MEQGDIYLTRLDPTEDNEQAGTRPVVIVSGQSMNEIYNLVWVLPLSSKVKNFASCLKLKKKSLNGLTSDSEVITYQIRSISKKSLLKKLGKVEKDELGKIMGNILEVLTL